MSKNKIISRKNLPTGLPVHWGLTIILALRVFDAPAWLYGAAGAFWVVWLIAAAIVIASAEYLEVFSVKEVQKVFTTKDVK